MQPIYLVHVTDNLVHVTDNLVHVTDNLVHVTKISCTLHMAEEFRQREGCGLQGEAPMNE